MNNDIMLSIYVPTYNHEKYIEEALKSILNQKTKYTFEVLVGEDASTDGTRAIIKCIEEQNPGFFQVFYREQNMSKLQCNNGRDLQGRCRGKYIICLEGDDFWTDEYKIEKQIDFLESHPEYYAVAHNCVVVGADSKPNGEYYPECKDNEYSLKHFREDILPGQYTTLMCRNYFLDDSFDKMLVNTRLAPGDRYLYFSLLCSSRIFCMQDVMSAYRHIVHGGTSFSATFKYSFLHTEEWHKNLIKYAKKQKNEEAILTAEYLYARNLAAGVKHKEISCVKAIRKFGAIDRKIGVLKLYSKRIIKKMRKN